MFDRTYPFLVFVLLFDQDTIKLFSHDGINDIHFGLVYYPQLITRLVDYRLERRGGSEKEKRQIQRQPPLSLAVLE